MTADAYGGVWTYALELADALAGRGDVVQLATMGRPPSPGQRRQLEASAVASVHESRFALEWMPDPWEDVTDAGHWLLELADELRPDVVHLNGYCHGALEWPAPAVVVAHSCVLSWWWSVRRREPPRDTEPYRARVRAGLAGADAVVAPSRWMLDQLDRWYGQRDGTVIPNCRRPRGGRPPKEPFVLGAGRLWDEAKNLDLLERVAPRLRWPVFLAGDDAAPGTGAAHGAGACSGAAGQKGAAVRLGLLDEASVAAWLGRASVFAAPARYEPFGLAILEAALSRCALVLGDIPSLREIWGGAAVFVDPDDEDGWAATLERVCADGAETERLGAAARRRARAYEPQACARSYARLYATLSTRVGSLP